MACANGVGFGTAIGGPVNLLDPDLTYPRTLRASLGYDRTLPWGTVATVEALYTKGLRDFQFINRALAGPVGTDSHGRVLYGTVDQFGVASPRFVSNQFPDVIDAVNQSRNYAWDIAFQLAKRFSGRLEATLAYAYSRARDVQTPLSQLAEENALGRPAFSGPQDLLPVGISDLDQPHRLVAAATWSAPWRKWRTVLSLFYVGGSGSPFTYTAAADSTTGDLNADGSSLNDPIYVPRDAADPTEIRFGGTPEEITAQERALNALIAGTPCLSRQRGTIMQRNSCRSPWVHSLSLALRQAVPGPWGTGLSVEVQAFNVLNLLNSGWGLAEQPNTALLRRVGQTAGGPAESEPIFRFDTGFAPFASKSPDSYYQFQVAIRYSF
jgi:hypothetical protein